MDFKGVIPPDLATGLLWPQIADLLSQALPYGRGEYTLDDIKDGIDLGVIFAIGAVTEQSKVEFVAVCTIYQTPHKRILYVLYGAGRGGARLRDPLVDAAKALGCDWIEQRSRASVARLYERAGFSTDYTVAILEIHP